MDSFLSILISVVSFGLLGGTIYALVAAGLSLIYGTALLPQAANGQIFVGAGLLFWYLEVVQGWPLWLAAPFTILTAGVFAIFLEVSLFRRFYGSADRNITYLILTLGLAQVLSGIYSGFFGKLSDSFRVVPPVSGFAVLDPFPISNARVLAFVLACALLLGLIMFLRLHRIGRALRAVFQNRDVAQLRGIDTHKTYRFAIVLGTIITACGGIIYSFAFALDLSVGWIISLISFAIMVVGGPGSILGAVVVGMVFGFAQAIVSVVSDPTVATFAYLIAMLGMLLIRPNGLFLR